ncbi:MAG: hypothetical protein ACO31I_05280 [Prochlorotrichaceae cyanobacterium]
MVMLRYWKSALTGSIAIGLLGGVVGLAGFELSSPASVQAYEARLSVTLEREPDETFQTMLKRAEVVARAAVQRAFDTDILATDVSVFINGRSGGLEAPLLSVQISRFQWQSFPDTRRWATYYPATQSLLRLDPLPISPSAAPAIGPGSTLAPGSTLPGATGTPTVNPSGQTVPVGTSPQDTEETQLIVPETIRPIDIPTRMPSTVPDELLLEDP